MAFVYNTRRTPMTFEKKLQAQPLDFHQLLPHYVPTPLRELDKLAHELGIGKLLLKDESDRIGLPSFKILGASWAIYRVLSQRLNQEFETFEDFKNALKNQLPLTLVAATDGNHGRAVAYMARLLGLQSIIFVPDDMSEARRSAILGEGAQMIVVNGSYDDAVELSAQRADERHLVISDTAWEGYEEIPRWVIEGYSTIFAEIDAPHEVDIVFVQMGVGALASAVINYYRRHDLQKPMIIGVEPESAACVLESLRAGRSVTVPGPHPSIMAGLNCGVPSSIALPLLLQGMDAVISVPDERAREAMRLLARHGVVAGETGAAGLAGLYELLQHPEPQIKINSNSVVLVISTEGATDLDSYHIIVDMR